MPDTAPPADGVAITSSYLQTMVREQVVRTVTSSTRPASVEGALIYETDTDLMLVYNGTAWRPIVKATATNGGILQVQSTTVTASTFSTASTSFTDITGLSVSITPVSTSSKIMVQVDVHGGGSAVLAAYFQLVRGSTNIPSGVTADGNRSILMAGTDTPYDAAFSNLDSPATAAAVTYKVQVKVTANTFYLNRRGATDIYRGTSTITVMEVAG